LVRGARGHDRQCQRQPGAAVDQLVDRGGLVRDPVLAQPLLQQPGGLVVRGACLRFASASSSP
jgi:hypothetical protein